MTLDQIALIAEIIAAAAIVISLIFVGIELRDNTRATRTATASDAVKSLEDFYLTMGASTETSDVVARANIDPDSLAGAERVQFIGMAMTLFLAQQHNFYAFKQGLLDADFKNSLMMPIKGLADNPGMHWFWQQRRTYFRPEFQAEVDRIFAASSGADNAFWKEIAAKGNIEWAEPKGQA